MFCILNNNTNAYFKLDMCPTLFGVHKDHALMLDNLNILPNGRNHGSCRGMSLQNPWLVPHCCQSPLHARATPKTLLHTVRALGLKCHSQNWPMALSLMSQLKLNNTNSLIPKHLHLIQTASTPQHSKQLSEHLHLKHLSELPAHKTII